MCVAIQGPNGIAVAEAGVDRVLEVRVRVDEAGQDRRVREVALGAAGADLDDPAVLEAHDGRLRSAARRPGSTQSAETAESRAERVRRRRRSARRSSSTEAQIEAS